MASKSGISWTHATWDPVTGCEKVSTECKYCYAEREWESSQHIPIFTGRKFTDVACHDERLDQPLRWQRQRLIFVNSRADLFHKDVPVEFIDKVFAIMGLSFVMRDDPHVFQVLTKRPERMKEYMDDPNTVYRVTMMMKKLGPELPGENSAPVWPLPNVWMGVSVGNQEAANERIPILLNTPAAVRWISCEPLLGEVTTTVHIEDKDAQTVVIIDSLTGEINKHYADRRPSWRAFGTKIDWVVIGGESGDKARLMEYDWAMRLIVECKTSNTPVFFKQWGEWIPRPGQVLSNGKTPTEMDPNGTTWEQRIIIDPDHINEPYSMQRVGTKLAGDLIDGEMIHEWPESAYQFFNDTNQLR